MVIAFHYPADSGDFRAEAEQALGHPIEVISGIEEARLIYNGVTHSIPPHEGLRLVMDIGGGSTELVIGEGLKPLQMESLQYGCVSLTRRFFPDGKIDAGRWQKAVQSVMADLQELKIRYLETGWETAIGSSGTIKAVEEICRRMGWLEKDISADALLMLRDILLEFDTIDAVKLPGLTERRHPVLIGGLAMLQACFDVLELETMKVSPYALREGVLLGEGMTVVIAGPPNVGKSSLLNWLFGRSLARIAKAPGKTRTLNFYLVNGAYYLVDLPGYGYAKVAKKLQAEWGRELERYIADEERLAGVVTLMDVRHGPTRLDLDLQDLLHEAGLERVIVLTKADKVGRGQRVRMQNEIQQRFGLESRPMAVSVRTGEGRRELVRQIDELVSQWRHRQLGD